MAEFPALPLWTDAYLGDTTHLSTLEHGAYLLLLMAMWRSKECQLPNDDRLLAKYARLTGGQWARVKPSLWPFFKVGSDVISQGRLTDEYNLVRRKSHKASDSARQRWLKNNETPDAGAVRSQCEGNATTTTTTPMLVGGGACAPACEGTDPEITPPATAPNDPEQAARTVVQKFLEIRDELWPAWPNRPTNPDAMALQAQNLIEDGAPPHVLIRTIEVEMRDAHRSGQHATTNPFKAYRLSIANAIADHRTTGGADHAPAAHSSRRTKHQPYDPAESRRRTAEGYALAMERAERDG